MTAVVAASKNIKSSLRQIAFKDIIFTQRRNKESRYLGYYKHKLSTAVYQDRKQKYRDNVLKPLENIPTLQERLAALNRVDPVLDHKVDIGFITSEGKKVSVKDRLLWRKEIANLKQKANAKPEKINIDDVQEDCSVGEGLLQLQNIASHYGVFDHLYQHAYFTPCVALKVSYDYDSEHITPVYSGNILQASEASAAPNVTFKSKAKDLWTLVLTNLDGHLLNPESEYLHWFIGNIKGNAVETGEVVCDYLQPFPMRGTGYHRLVFVLYKQDQIIDFSSMKKTVPCKSLSERTFKTFEFYKQHQDLLTPAGLAFFQCTWDESLTTFFHDVLNMQEPIFEYDVPPLYIKPQVQYPHLEAFNLYLDRYRDPKEVKKEVLLKRLKTVHPFKEETPMPKYPCLHKPDNYRFSWQARDMMKERLRLGKYRELRPASVYPQEDNQFPYWTKA